MAGHQSDRGGDLYEERLWTSWRFIAASIGCGAALGVLGVLASPSDTTSAWITTFPWFVALGVVVALVFWTMNFARKLVVYDSRLQMGQRPLGYGFIDSVRYVDRAEAKRVANGMRYSPIRPSTWGHRSRAQGLWWQPWMKDALLVQLKPGSRVITDGWLIGTRHPQQLLELIQARIGQEPSVSRAPADVAPPLT